NYSRSPTLVKIGHERMERKKVIERFVKETGGYVSLSYLEKHFINSLGWTNTMLEQNIAASENLLKTEKGLVHLESLEVDPQDLYSIFTYTKQKIMDLQNSCSITTVFEERKSFLIQMGIKDARILYHLIEKYYPE